MQISIGLLIVYRLIKYEYSGGVYDLETVEERYLYIVFILTVLGVATTVWAVNLQLILFHIYIKYKGISTYEFVTAYRSSFKIRDSDGIPDLSMNVTSQDLSSVEKRG